MKKILSILFGASLILATSAHADGMIGIKYGVGELDAENDAYTSGSTSVAAQSASKDNEYGAFFAEFNTAAEGLSLGIEYIPFTATIRLDKGESGTGADVDNYTTLYAQYMHDMGAAGVYAKVGYSMADIDDIVQTNSSTTVNSQDSSLEGPMVGIGFQSPELANGIIGRVEATYTEFDDVTVTTTSNGSASVAKTGRGELTTFSVSVAKAF